MGLRNKDNQSHRNLSPSFSCCCFVFFFLVAVLFWPCFMAYRILVSQAGMQPRPPVAGAQSLNHRPPRNSKFSPNFLVCEYLSFFSKNWHVPPWRKKSQRCFWYLPGRTQQCCYMSYNTQDKPRHKTCCLEFFQAHKSEFRSHISPLSLLRIMGQGPGQTLRLPWLRSPVLE